jgi:hypothetical protein
VPLAWTNVPEQVAASYEEAYDTDADMADDANQDDRGMEDADTNDGVLQDG